MTFLVIASCTKLEDLNKDTKRPTEVPGVTLFSAAQKSFADQIASTNVNYNVFKLWTQHWTETTYTDEANYDIINRTIADNVWREWYRDVLIDFKQATIVITANEGTTQEEKDAAANQLQIIEICNVFVWERMVTLWGNIPYTDALDIDNILPTYTPAETIYSDLLTRLDAAIAGLNTNAGSFGDADLFYHGDVAAWKKFAYTLKLKMGTIINNPDIVGAAMDGAFESNDDNCEMVYLGSPPNTNPLYVDLTLSGRQDFIGSTLINEYMNPNSDPRLPAYFTFAPDTNVYIGGVYGASNPYADFSHISDPLVSDPTFPCLILSYVEVEFYLAEYYARQGDAISAETHYNGGIAASFDYWHVDIGDYMSSNDVIYDQSNWEKSIGTQSYIAFYNNGYIGWTQWRRLQQPALSPPPTSEFTYIPLRFTYPVFEQTLNGANYTEAAAAIGGDLMNTKLWFLK